jgi:hypothetical protein
MTLVKGKEKIATPFGLAMTEEEKLARWMGVEGIGVSQKIPVIFPSGAASTFA